jgi:hypothetical protein
MVPEQSFGHEWRGSRFTGKNVPYLAGHKNTAPTSEGQRRCGFALMFILRGDYALRALNFFIKRDLRRAALFG